LLSSKITECLLNEVSLGRNINSRTAKQTEGSVQNFDMLLNSKDFIHINFFVFFSEFFNLFTYSTTASVLIFREGKRVRRRTNMTHSVLNNTLSKMSKTFSHFIEAIREFGIIVGMLNCVIYPVI
jgi:hypothetical protein